MFFKLKESAKYGQCRTCQGPGRNADSRNDGLVDQMTVREYAVVHLTMIKSYGICTRSSFGVHFVRKGRGGHS